MHNRLFLFTILLWITITLVACGTTPTPAPEPAGSAALEVKGKVTQELRLSLKDLQTLGVQQLTGEHPKSGPQEYEGVFLNAVLDEAGLQGDATTLVMTAADGYVCEVAIADIKACAECMVAIEGSTLNMVMPGLASKAWVKTVISIEVK